MNVKDIRRENMRALARSIGGISAIADKMGKSQGQISHLIGSTPIKNIGDRIAAQVEEAFDKPPGWLDKPHPEVSETAAYYDNYQTVPLIYWEQIQTWRQKDQFDREEVRYWVGSSIARMSTHAFAVEVQDDSMEASSGVSFPIGSIILVDPDIKASSGAFVVASTNKAVKPTFKQFILDGGKHLLKPLNPRYPIHDLSSSYEIYGVVRQVMYLYDAEGRKVYPKKIDIPVK